MSKTTYETVDLGLTPEEKERLDREYFENFYPRMGKEDTEVVLEEWLRYVGAIEAADMMQEIIKSKAIKRCYHCDQPILPKPKSFEIRVCSTKIEIGREEA
jgi:hypothetical protein